MRIIGGQYKRRTIQAPRGKLTRPTSDRTREAIFNMVDSRLELQGAQVLDLFAGTGALGLEAVSRGAASATLVEQNPLVLRISKDNAETLGAAEACSFLRMDAISYLKHHQGAPFDLILADPPYELEQLPLLPELAFPHLTRDGCFVLEHDRRHDFSAHPQCETARPYGRTVVSVFFAPD